MSIKPTSQFQLDEAESIPYKISVLQALTEKMLAMTIDNALSNETDT
jgi:hypothetical protein